MGSRKHYLSLEQLFQGYVCYSRNKSSSKGDSHLTNRFCGKLSAMRAGCLGLSTAKGVKDEISLYLCKHGRLPFDQKFRNFRNRDKLHGNSLGKVPENTEIVEFSKIEPFNRKFRKFRDESQMERKFPGRNFRKFGYTSRGCPLFQNLCKSPIFHSALASSFGCDHNSELDISRKESSVVPLV